MSLLSGLLAFYDFNSAVTDSSGNGRNLTASGGEAYTTGLVGQAINAGSPARSPFNAGMNWNTAWSVSVWLKVPVGASAPGFGSRVVVDDGSHTSCQISTNGDDLSPSYALQMGSSTALYEQAVAAGWRHAVATFDGTNVRFYVDGALASGPTATSNDTSNKNLTVNCDNDFTVPVDLLGIWSRALSAVEIADLYHGGAGLSYAQMVAFDTPAPPVTFAARQRDYPTDPIFTE